MRIVPQGCVRAGQQVVGEDWFARGGCGFVQKQWAWLGSQAVCTNWQIGSRGVGVDLPTKGTQQKDSGRAKKVPTEVLELPFVDPKI